MVSFCNLFVPLDALLCSHDFHAVFTVTNKWMNEWMKVAVTDLIEDGRVAVQQRAVHNVRMTYDPTQIGRRKPRLVTA